MASSLAAISGDRLAPFAIVPRISPDSYKKVKLTRMVNNNKRTVEMPVITECDVELICVVYLAFDQAMRPSALNLDTPELCFEEFRKCLSFKYHTMYDHFRELQRVNGQDTQQGFNETRRRFLELYARDEALANQEAYFNTYKKLFRMDCNHLADRLLEINHLTAVLNEGNPYWTEQQLKNYYFNMMPFDFQLSFNRYGDRRLSDPNYSLHELALNMQTKMITSQIMATSREALNRRRPGNDQAGQRPQQVRRLNDGGRGGFVSGRWYNNSNWHPNNNNNNGPPPNYYNSNARGQGFSGSVPPFNNQGGRSFNFNNRGFNNNSGRGYNQNRFGGRGFGGRGGFNQGRGYGFGRGGFGQGRGNGNNGGNNQQQRGRQADNFQVDDNFAEQNQDQVYDQYLEEQQEQQEQQEEFGDSNMEQQDEYYDDEQQEENHFLDDFGFGESY
jgi:hypothetical protein